MCLNFLHPDCTIIVTSMRNIDVQILLRKFSFWRPLSLFCKMHMKLTCVSSFSRITLQCFFQIGWSKSNNNRSKTLFQKKRFDCLFKAGKLFVPLFQVLRQKSKTQLHLFGSLELILMNLLKRGVCLSFVFCLRFVFLYPSMFYFVY